MKLMIAASAVFVLAGMCRAAVHTETVSYKAGDTDCEGFIAYDDAQPGRRPGVLVIHEWLGLNDYAKKRSVQLAELGYVAFACDMYGKGVRGTSPQDGPKLSAPLKENRFLMRQRATAGLAVLRGNAKVETTKIAAIGYCFGGTSALELARGGANVVGVVGFHAGLSTNLPAKPGEVKAKVLVCHGADDPHVPPAEVAAFEEEMRKAGADWQLNSYGGAVHGFTNPSANDKAHGVAYNAEADRRSWQAMKDFFAEVFGK
jgi:dienelactone hydrolase